MKNLEKEIAEYVESKQSIWSDRTIPVVRSILLTLSAHWSNPYANYKKLIKAGKSKYTIKQYFICAGKFEEETRGSTKYKDFLRRNNTSFRNCYKEKTRLLKPEEFQRFLAMYQTTNPQMYNLLVLMGTAGLRITEALNLQWEDISDGFIKVIGKGDKQRLVPFDVNTLIRAAGDTGKIVRKLAYRFLFDRDMKPFTPHDFRAYYATQISQIYRELSVKDLARLLGHASISTTEKYMRSDLNRIKKVLEEKR